MSECEFHTVEEYHRKDEAQIFLYFREDDLMVMCIMRVILIRGIAVWEAATLAQVGISPSFSVRSLRYAAHQYEEYDSEYDALPDLFIACSADPT